MRANIHPQWYDDAKVSCACGNTFTVGATKPELRVEICSHCHPFFTGEMKFVDTLGRVERFQQKQKAAVVTAAVLAEKKKKKKEREASLRSPKSLKDMLMGLK
ncbi:50S ribosomal protein L31 [Candidatus Gottesmanbacteria bacterium RIFCSPLOWO2_01_FULL_48_11]|uniref:Large ribosomal subunit protein bL31 n=2 Tax=Candidatus Gottesmaniibacteriota TaxID=1752720 RepID=A0A0G1WBX5_9BACT|nr:MAG: 50S ribosomal protein L31 [Candidatus Gottesmanbacteria bacterium GW2011_GWA2_47_9]OGG28356.1 MAG: 50S ribosomal protein L31 [Candidatus Gottesmanbacteria bacterium RIFCSPLOWO2_01_FULL_48_11]